MTWLQDNDESVEDDDTPWCSAFVNFICKECGLERSHSNRARSWLKVGRSIRLQDAEKGDIVILKRGKGKQPGPNVIRAKGHVAFFSHFEGNCVCVLGGNQNKNHEYDEVCEKQYDTNDILDVRRLSNE